MAATTKNVDPLAFLLDRQPDLAQPDRFRDLIVQLACHFSEPRRKYPSQPTTSLPGTRDKIEVLIERCKTLQQLWHPCDEGQSIREAAYSRFASAMTRIRGNGRRPPKDRETIYQDPPPDEDYDD